MRVALLTISSSRARGEAPDRSGERLAALAANLGAEIEAREVIPDEQGKIEGRLLHWCEQSAVTLVLTSGGTGLALDDVTPEATRAVIEREAPGIAEAMRAASKPHTPHWMLSRGVAGTRGSTLIVNFPGSPKAIDETGAALAASLPHALDLLAGRPSEHRPD
ncbi:MAG: MogA/MoaB family molybdenum cofactor biosynthesis protein [Solirubrobacterales bacterium]|nr:MogA/MoaB family molybdenum cofactor biosynthesis protein [Solirubrobacterales bacterium]